MTKLFEWYDRVGHDRRVVGLGVDERSGVQWVYADCRSEQAYESLFDQFWIQGWRTLARRRQDSLWLEPVRE
jgi:hypothetical protein